MVVVLPLIRVLILENTANLILGGDRLSLKHFVASTSCLGVLISAYCWYLSHEPLRTVNEFFYVVL